MAFYMRFEKLKPGSVGIVVGKEKEREE